MNNNNLFAPSGRSGAPLSFLQCYSAPRLTQCMRFQGLVCLSPIFFTHFGCKNFAYSDTLGEIIKIYLS